MFLGELGYGNQTWVYEVKREDKHRGDEGRLKAGLLKTPVVLASGASVDQYISRKKVVSTREQKVWINVDLKWIWRKKWASGPTSLVNTAHPSCAYGVGWLRLFLCQSKALPSLELEALCFVSLTPLNIGTFVHQASFLFRSGFSPCSIRKWLSYPKY